MNLNLQIDFNTKGEVLVNGEKNDKATEVAHFIREWWAAEDRKKHTRKWRKAVARRQALRVRRQDVPLQFDIDRF